MSQLKTSKTSLGSSLDQGLDKPIQSLDLNSLSKRICKSEESAIDNTTLTLPRDTSSISSNETLNETMFKNLRDRTSSHQTSFSKFTDEGFMGNNIEITIPTSVSKPKTNSNNEERSTMRQRSSNSISSCEMALSNSQVDGEESSNGNSEKYSDQLEYSSTNKEDAMSRSYSISESSPMVVNAEAANAVVCEEKFSLLTSETKSKDCSGYSKEITDSSLSLDEILEYTEISEQKQRAISVCSDPDDGLTSPKSFARKRYDSESRYLERKYLITLFFIFLIKLSINFKNKQF